MSNLLGRYSKLDRTDEGIYLKAFSGDYCRVDRQCREPVVLQQPCLAALWLVQPDKLETLLAERSLTDGGMIPRLLPCHTHAQPRPIVDGVEGIPANTANAWGMLAGKLIHTFRMASEPFVIEPAPDASGNDEGSSQSNCGTAKRRIAGRDNLRGPVERTGLADRRLPSCRPSR